MPLSSYNAAVENRNRYASAWRGFALGGLPGLALIALLEWFNPFFVDEPYSLWLVAVGLPGLVAAGVGSLFPAKMVKWPLGITLTTAAVVVGLSVESGQSLDELKLLVIGVDGATWDVVDPMLDELPTFAAIKKEGATGVLRADEPMFSPLLWTTIASGKYPTEHGARGFRIRADAVKVPRFWDIAEANGHRVGIYKWLVTWPPRRAKGFIVPGWLAPSAETEPQNLSFVKELELSHRTRRQRVKGDRGPLALAKAGVLRGFRWSTLRDAVLWLGYRRVGAVSDNEWFFRMNLLRVRLDRDVFVHALHEHCPGVATFTTYAPDALGHRFWKYFHPQGSSEVDAAGIAAFGQAIPDAYRQADQIIAELRRLLPDNGRMVVLSDHGFKAMDGTDGPLLPRTGALTDRLKAQFKGVEVVRVGTKVLAVVDPAEQDQLYWWFVAQQLDGTDIPLYRAEVVDERTVAVSLAIDELDEGLTVAGMGLASYASVRGDMSGDHAAEGIFAAIGPGVKPGSNVDLRQVDVTPILLAALDLAQGNDMTGRVPENLWPPVGVQQSWDPLREGLEFVEVEDQLWNTEMLEALGYLDGDDAPTRQ